MNEHFYASDEAPSHVRDTDGITHCVDYENNAWFQTLCDVWILRRECAEVDGPMTCFACMNESKKK